MLRDRTATVVIGGKVGELILLGTVSDGDRLAENVARLAHNARDFRARLDAVTSWAVRPAQGAGFGSAEQNDRVEAAAIAAVTCHLEAIRWTVTSVEEQKLGYDLLCRRRGAELHVEVKGIAGWAIEFTMTKGERTRWGEGERFRLAIVTTALTNPTVAVFKSSAIGEFMFEPLTYRVAQRTPARGAGSM